MSFWQRNDSIEGLEPEIELKCPICGDRLFLRRSIVHPVSDVYHDWEHTGYANDMTYKCFDCDIYLTFGVPILEDYYHELYRRRGNTDRYIPMPKWKEDEVLKEKLRAMGYL